MRTAHDVKECRRRAKRANCTWLGVPSHASHGKKYVNIPSGKYIYVHKYVYICVYTYLCKMDENRSYAGLT